MPATVFLLPVPLILLVHLHILEYPHANKPEYDHNIFNPRVRGLRERTKLLEDVFYFLVGRLEGSGKTILPSYPCLHPSDTVAFRTSLSKYLESLRHQSLYPPSKVTANAHSGKTIRKQTVNQSKGVAWWWKDVVVRKSLLEECSGEKFERLLLSVSTHALLQCISSTISLPENASNLLQNQPVIYSDLLYKYKSARHTWSHASSVLLQRQEDLRAIRERLNSDDGSVASKYPSFDTQRLVALVDSKLQDLLRDLWRGREGRRALAFLAELSGLKPQEASISSHLSDTRLTLHPAESKYTTTPPPLLPIAAAHHPAYLRKIRRSVFSSANPKTCSNARNIDPGVAPTKTSRSFPKIALSGRLDAEIRMKQALSAALARVKQIGQELISRVKAFETKRDGKPTLDPGLLLDLWQPDLHGHNSVSFDTQPTPELLSSLALYTPSMEKTLDVRIDHLREIVLSPYPPIPNLSAPRCAVADSSAGSLRGTSKIPRAKPEPTRGLFSANGESNEFACSSPTQIPERSSRQLVTSTPPPAVKPRSVNTRRLPVGQETGKHGVRRGSRLPRKSIRFSLATNRRPSLFASDDEEEIHRIVRGTHEESFEDPHAPVTPRAKGMPIRSIFTGTKGSTVKRPKQSYPMAFKEPAVTLPSLVSSSSSFNDLFTDLTDDDADFNDGWTNGPGPFQEAPTEAPLDGEDGGGLDEGPSMTLRDILLRADVTQFDLLGAEEHEHLGDESFDWD